MNLKGEYTEIGNSLPRVDGRAKVTGAAKYAGDYYFPRELWAQVVRSPYPHARIKKVDTTKAKKLKGVKNVITGDYYKKRGGLYLADTVPVLCGHQLLTDIGVGCAAAAQQIEGAV